MNEFNPIYSKSVERPTVPPMILYSRPTNLCAYQQKSDTFERQQQEEQPLTLNHGDKFVPSNNFDDEAMIGASYGSVGAKFIPKIPTERIVETGKDIVKTYELFDKSCECYNNFKNLFGN